MTPKPHHVDAERWREIEEILHRVLARPQDQRTAYLEEACAGDSQLQGEVASLLNFDGGRHFLDDSALRSAEPRLLPRANIEAK